MDGMNEKCDGILKLEQNHKVKIMILEAKI